MSNGLKWLAVVAVILGGSGVFGWQWWQAQQSALPPGIASGNGA